MALQQCITDMDLLSDLTTKLRTLLGNPSTRYLSDTDLQTYLDLACTEYQNYADSDAKWMAVLYNAARKALMAYADIVERELGRVPAYFGALVEEFEKLEKQAKQKLSPESNDNAQRIAYIELTPTIEEDIIPW